MRVTSNSTLDPAGAQVGTPRTGAGTFQIAGQHPVPIVTVQPCGEPEICRSCGERFVKEPGDVWSTWCPECVRIVDTAMAESQAARDAYIAARYARIKPGTRVRRATRLRIQRLADQAGRDAWDAAMLRLVPGARLAMPHERAAAPGARIVVAGAISHREISRRVEALRREKEAERQARALAGHGPIGGGVLVQVASGGAL